ncbi:hypothetical protein LIER_02505 [Lithospermum erythrorhizon]|uniref:Uncharacterized protein n=1 Tax=Lithospermum erythrorhizon TaxID=34254 RepID=A0AAV3NR86_LITER
MIWRSWDLILIHIQVMIKDNSELGMVELELDPVEGIENERVEGVVPLVTPITLASGSMVWDHMDLEHKVFNEFLMTYSLYYTKISRYIVRKE